MAQDIERLVQSNKEQLAKLEKALGYRFTDLRLLQRALIHSSFAFEQIWVGEDNEKLEFLGDAVLDLIIGHTLFKRYIEMREGDLTKIRASLVNEHHLALMAREIDLGSYLLLGRGEENTNGRQKPSILSSSLEALVGALFEDGGYNTVAGVVEMLFQPYFEEKRDQLLVGDAKSNLQEHLQEKYQEKPTYQLRAEDGPAHQRVYTVDVLFRSKLLATGQGGSKKEAEQQAAAEALAELSNPK